MLMQSYHKQTTLMVSYTLKTYVPIVELQFLTLYFNKRGHDTSQEPDVLSSFSFLCLCVSFFLSTFSVWTLEHETLLTPTSPAAQICTTSRALRCLSVCSSL